MDDNLWDQLKDFVKLIKETPIDDLEFLFKDPKKYIETENFKQQLQALGVRKEWIDNCHKEFNSPQSREALKILLRYFSKKDLRYMFHHIYVEGVD